ncbi:MAG: HEAT repeat domain-containing protein [Planctomycetes bacterium]|nr:HEAT repeat domain-containing protein [Planctomycetota bacterium]
MNAILRRLTQLLESNDMELRIAAIRVIAEIGFSSRAVVQSLGRCLREPHDDLRLVALQALARLGARDVASMVVPLILSPGPVREQAMGVISAVGATVVPQLKVLYSQADFHGKRAVITALARIGGKAALHFLLKILPDEPFEIQKHLALSVCESLDRMATGAQAPIFSMVLRLLRRKDAEKKPPILVTGAILLGHFRGQRLAAKGRAVLRSLAEPRWPPEVRRHAFVSFNRLIPECRLSVAEEQFLWKSMLDEDWHNVAQHALQGFQKLELPRKVLPKLIDLLHRSPHFSVHIHIFDRIQASDQSDVADAILPFLADPRYRVREAAEAALRKMPTSIESLFGLLMKTEDLEVTQRINAILRDFPQETRQKYVERAATRLLTLLEEGDPHYRSFLEFVKHLDPEPLRKRIYQKAQALKKGRAKDKWERMAALLQILWENHLITAEGRYLLAVALVRSSPKDLSPASRRANLGLRVIRALIYDDREDLTKRLLADKDLGPEEYFYLGFHFAEEGEDMRPFSTGMLEHVVRKYPRAKVVAAAAQKLELQARAAQEAAKALEAASKGKKGDRATPARPAPVPVSPGTRPGAQPQPVGTPGGVARGKPAAAAAAAHAPAPERAGAPVRKPPQDAPNPAAGKPPVVRPVGQPAAKPKPPKRKLPPRREGAASSRHGRKKA